MAYGGQCVVIVGESQMPMLCVISLGLQLQVSMKCRFTLNIVCAHW